MTAKERAAYNKGYNSGKKAGQNGGQVPKEQDAPAPQPPVEITLQRGSFQITIKEG